MFCTRDSSTASGAFAVTSPAADAARACGVASSESSDCSQGSADRRAAVPAAVVAGSSVSSVAASTRAATWTQLVPLAQLQ